MTQQELLELYKHTVEFYGINLPELNLDDFKSAQAAYDAIKQVLQDPPLNVTSTLRILRNEIEDYL